MSGITVILFAQLLLTGVLIWLDPIIREIRYLNREIKRAGGAEKKYWKAQRKKCIRANFFCCRK